MQEPFWKRLVEDLTKQGVQHPSLDRLREKLPLGGGGLRQIEMEIAQEMASSLGRAGEKVDVAILELELLGRAIESENDPFERQKKVASFNAKREQAQKALWELRVHREALGLRQNQHLAKHYPIPPKRT